MTRNCDCRLYAVCTRSYAYVHTPVAALQPIISSDKAALGCFSSVIPNKMLSSIDIRAVSLCSHPFIDLFIIINQSSWIAALDRYIQRGSDVKARSLRDRVSPARRPCEPRQPPRLSTHRRLSLSRQPSHPYMMDLDMLTSSIMVRVFLQDLGDSFSLRRFLISPGTHY